MNKTIRILLLEDETADAQLITRELRKSGLACTVQRVETKEYFAHELISRTPQLILSDHGLPCFDGLAALELAKDICPQVPFIFVCGKHGEEEVVEALKQGAADYVLKDHLSRLAPAVKRALRDADDTQKWNREYFRRMAEICPDALSATAIVV